MTETTNFGLNIAEQNDIVNPLIIDNGNYRKIDAQMKENQDCSVCTATELKSGTIHAITRDTDKEDTSMFRFTATSNFVLGDTFTVDEVPVTATLPDGTALSDGAFKVNGTVLCSLVGSLLTVYTNKDLSLTPTVITNNIFPTIADLIYPIGSIYMSTNSASPTNLFGGTWVQIKDSFLLACGDTYSAGASGGSASNAHTHTVTPSGTVDGHTLTLNEIPSHTHDYLGWDGHWTTAQTGGAGVISSDNPANHGCTYAGGGQAHSHGFTGTQSTTSQSSDTNNMPPYLAVYAWRRTA